MHQKEYVILLCVMCQEKKIFTNTRGGGRRAILAGGGLSSVGCDATVLVVSVSRIICDNYQIICAFV